MSQNHPTIKTRFGHLIGFFAVFNCLYNLTNAYTAKLTNHMPISNVASGFDSQIAFIPSMILPYSCSLWLLIVSFFITDTNKALQRLTLRLLLTTVLACLCFYWIPLKFSFQLPDADIAYQKLGINWRFAFALLHAVDKPYNQFPSLHVSYAVLLLVSLWTPIAVFHNRLIAYRLSLICLCAGIAVSTLFTWQHHILDVLGGLILAIFVLWIERRISDKLNSTSQKLVIRYLVLAVSGFLIIASLPTLFIRFDNAIYPIAIKFFAHCWLFSFGLLSFLYAKSNAELNGRIFSKNPDGHLTNFAYILQLPICASYYLLWQIMTKCNRLTPFTERETIQCQFYHQTIEICAGPKLSNAETANLTHFFSKYQKIVWLDVTSEISSSFWQLKQTQPTAILTYHYLPLLDLQPFDSLDITSLVHFLASVSYTLGTQSDDDAPVLILCQCTMGWSRSVAMLACCLAYFGQFCPHTIRQLIDSHYPSHHVTQDYLSDQTLINLQQKSSTLL